MYDDYAVDSFTTENGARVALYYDDNPFSPGDWDTLGTLCLNVRGYTLGEQIDTTYHALPVWIRAHRIAGHTVVPVRFSDHGSGGLALAACDEDRANGFIYTTLARADELGAPHDSLDRQLREEVAEWHQYVSDDVYGYVIESADGAELDSLWGLYGYDYAKQEATDAANSYDRNEINAHEIARVAAFG